MIRRLLLVLLLYSDLCIAQDSTALVNDRVVQFYTSQQVNIDTLNNQYLYYKAYDWLGTKYKYAGETKKGIDCSGFVAEIYSDVYCIKLDGGSKDIFGKVKPIKREELKEGDLVFFKIKKGQISHVGVYLKSNRFVHASVQSGVVVSSLDEAYYKKYFFSGGRLLVD